MNCKLAIIAILVIIGCAIAHAQVNKGDKGGLQVRGHNEESNRDHNWDGNGGNEWEGNGGNEWDNDDSNDDGDDGDDNDDGWSGHSSSGSATEAPATAAPTHAPATAAPTHAPSTVAPSQGSTSSSSKTSSSGSSSSSSSSSSTTTDLCAVLEATQQPLKLLVPLYVDPSSGSAWADVAAAAASVETVAIINPNSGPTSTLDSSYSSGMSTLRAAGVQLVGYVHTSYGDRSLSDCEADIDTYVSVFPGLIGIFFDEASADASYISYYESLYNYVLAKGYTQVILNPGTQPDSGYLDVSTNIVIFEDTGSNFASTDFDSWVTCASSSSEKADYAYRFSAIGYGISSSSSVASLISSMQGKGVGYVYVTDGADECCVYNDLATYYSSEASSIASMNA